MAVTTYRVPTAITSISIAGVEHLATDGILEIEAVPAHIHKWLLESLKFAEATAMDLESFVTGQTQKTEKASLIAALAGVGVKVDGRASLAYVQTLYNDAVAKGEIKTAAVATAATEASSASTTKAAPAVETTVPTTAAPAVETPKVGSPTLSITG